MEIKMTCRECGKEFTILVYPGDGYLEFADNGVALDNVLSDGSSTVDFYCSDKCKNGE